MYCHEDWPIVQQNYEAWWRREAQQPIIQLTAPRTGRTSPGVFDWWALAKPDVVPEIVLKDFLGFCEDTWFGGCAFPSFFFNLGPGVLAACCSGFLRYEEASATSWFENPQPWEVVEAYVLQERPWLHYLEETMTLFAQEAPEKFVLGMTDIGGVLDVLASFRGGQTLALDLFLEPDRVHNARRRILHDWNRLFDRLLAHIAPVQNGMSTWMGIWCPGTYYPIQCDFAAMISPEQFREFVLPDVVAQCNRLDHSIFHLDGPGQLAHVDMLLEIETLDGIQWVPGDGNPQCESTRWRALYEKILGGNKLLVLNSFQNVARVGEALQGLPAGRVLISAGATSEEEGRRLVQQLTFAK